MPTSTPSLKSSDTLGDLLRRSAARVPGKVAIAYRERRYSYAELDLAVDRVRAALSARGIRRGERVALLSHNNDAFVLIHFALARLGAILVPINFMLNAEEVAYILGHSAAVAVIAEDALVPVAAEAIARSGAQLRLQAAIDDGGPALPDDWEPVARWTQVDVADPAPVEECDLAGDDPVQLMYTSGTESRPKGATLSSRNLQSQYVSCIVDGDMRADDIELHALPLYHCAQLHCFLMPDLYLGASSIILRGADAATMLETIERERVTKLFCPPTVWIQLLRHPDFDRRDLSSLAKGYYGASIMPMEVIKELSARLPGVRLFNFYGQTEMSPLATVLQPEDQLRKLGSAGRPCINVETRVVDDEDRPVPAGTVGEIVHRGPQVMLGYWNDPDKTAEVFRNGWFHSGDLGVFDEDGYLAVVDRKKDMIKSGGENVASREVEEVIYQHPAVREAAVFAVPHPRWIEAVAVAVMVKPGGQLTAESLIAHCRKHLAGYKTPKYVFLVEDMPRNASGKILKRDLRIRFAAEVSQTD